MTKVAVLGVGSRVPSSDLTTNQTALAACGDNTGNLLFQHAIKVFLEERGADLCYPDLMPDDTSPMAIEESDLIVVPCADFLNPEYSLTGLWNRLRYCNKRCFPIGLGIGSDNPDIERLPKDTLSVLDYFKRYSNSICVRGQSTYNSLRSLGFEESQLAITGCFSNFMGAEEELRTSYLDKLKTLEMLDSPPLILSGDNPWKERTNSLERDIYQIFRSNKNALYLIQSHLPLVDLARPDLASADFYQLSLYAHDLLTSINPHGSYRDLISDIKQRYRLWFDIEVWLEALKPIIFSMGLRLHGNMASMQSGVPSLWITHDPRTKELADTMALPTIAQTELAVSESLYNNISLLFSEQIDSYFDKRRQLLSIAESSFAKARD